MTVMALAEHIEKCLQDRAEDLQVDKSNSRVTYTVTVSKQAFIVTVQELAKDAQEPALT